VTKVQREVLAAIRARGYLRSPAYHAGFTTTRIDGYPHRIGEATITALVEAGAIRRAVVGPYEALPDGRRNMSRMSAHIFVPVVGASHER